MSVTSLGQVPSGGGVSGPPLFRNILDTNFLCFQCGPGPPVAGWTWPIKSDPRTRSGAKVCPQGAISSFRARFWAKVCPQGAISSFRADENTLEEMTNYAIVEISGGYLYSSDGAFCSKAGNSTLSITGPFYTNIGVQEEDNPVKSQYYDFSKGTYECVPSKTATKTNGVYFFGFEIISDTWTYVIDNCSQTKTAIGANEEVTYSFRSYKQKGTEKEPVPWIAQMRVVGDGYVWHDNHSFGPLNGWPWTTNRDDELGNADKGDGSIDTNEEYIITFRSTRSDTYTVQIIASDAGGRASYVFAPVVQTISSTPSTNPIVFYEGSSTNPVTISYNSFIDADPKPDNILRVSFSLTDQNANLENESLKIYDAWSGNTIEFNLATSVTVGTKQYYCDINLESEWISSVKSKSIDLTVSLGWGGVITKVELIQ